MSCKAVTIPHQKPLQSPGEIVAEEQFFQQLVEQRTENQAGSSLWHCPKQTQQLTKLSTAGSGRKKSWASLSSCSPRAPQAGRTHMATHSLWEGLFGWEESRSGLSQVSFGCLIWPCWDLHTLVHQKWQERSERRTGAARPGAGSWRCRQEQDSHPAWAVFRLQGHLARPAPGPCCSKPSSGLRLPPPKGSQGHVRPGPGSQQLALFQTSQGEQTRESVSVITTNAAH